MPDREKILKGFREVCEAYFAEPKAPFEPGKTKIPLNTPSYGAEEVCEVLDSLLSTFVTMGKKVSDFEKAWGEYLGIKNVVMVNSGSTANLLALSLLSNPAIKNPLRPGDEVVVPAVAWSTDFFPVLNVGCTPVLVDVDIETFNMNIDQLKAAISPKTRAILAVHLLGNPAAMDEINEIAQEKNLYVIEDSCEAHGATLNDKKVGTIGDIGIFSFFFSHHITTIEGGALVTDNDEWADIARSLRAHGWARDRADYKTVAAANTGIDPRFLFVNTGFNVRPTDLQGGFGLQQLKRLENNIKIRRDNVSYWKSKLEPYSEWVLLHEERPGTRHVWFGYPITVRPNAPFAREKLTKWLESRGIETRPIMTGNMAEQPAMRFLSHKIIGNLENSRSIHRNSFFFGNHSGIGKPERGWIADSLIEFFEKETG